jgi:hypothetical protein
MSEALTSLLDSVESPDDCARQIADAPGLLAEAKSALPALKAVAQAKAGTDGVKAVIGRRLVTYPQPQRTDGETAAWWADYYDVLEDVSLASLEAGMRAYVAMPDSEFMPKPGRLRELAFSAPCRAYTRYYRATRAIQLAEMPELTGDAEPNPRANPEEVKAMLAEFEAKTAAGAKKFEMPSIAGKVDERGITPQMRELMVRRHQDAQR